MATIQAKSSYIALPGKTLARGHPRVEYLNGFPGSRDPRGTASTGRQITLRFPCAIGRTSNIRLLGVCMSNRGRSPGNQAGVAA